VDLRWQAAAGVDAGYRAFHPTVLVGMRTKLRASGRPRRLFEGTKIVARATGAMKSRARVLDSTPVFDAVATQDTVTQVRAAIRKVLAALGAAGSPLAAQVRAALRRDDDYSSPGKPPCDWDDPAAREALVDELVTDALAALGVLDGQPVPVAAGDAVGLLALVAGQDVEQGEDGVFRIARKTARDRVISTVDTQARHGHKSRHRRFDGYKAHLSVDPDSELTGEVAATAANAPDRDVAGELLEEHADSEDKPEVVGDSAYGDAATRARLEEQGFTVIAKCPPARNSGGRFAKDRFAVDLEHGTVTCPAGQTALIVGVSGGGGKASFRPWCATCPLRAACTASRRGRTIAIHPQETILQRARHQQRDPGWQQRYRADRPTVERKISHFTRRAWGGRNARTRGLARITTDLATRAGAINWARLAVLGLDHDRTGWALRAT
jgi:IS5 family transposase